MRHLAGILFLTLICGDLTGRETQNERREKMEFFVEPRESVLPVVVRQPDCPLELENLEFHHYKIGGGAQNYGVRNRSAKPIIRFVVATIGFGGGGSLDDIKPRTRSEWLMPGESWPRSRDGYSSSVVPLTNEMRKQYGIGPPMKAIVICLVVRVEFADGSIYSDEVVYKELKRLFENIERINR